MKISAVVTLKKDVLDPQGRVVKRTLNDMGYDNIKSVRQGKFFEVDLNEQDSLKAKSLVKQMCEKLLVNQIIEDFKIEKDKWNLLL